MKPEGGVPNRSQQLADISIQAKDTHMQQLLEITPAALLLVDEQGVIHLCNARAERLFGYSSSELLGQPLQSFIAETLSDMLKDPVQKDITSESVTTVRGKIESSANHRAGKRFPVQLEWESFSDAGRRFFLISVTDISQHKAEQQRLREHSNRLKNLLETAADGIHILDAEGNVVECSLSFARMLGYSREEASQLNVTDWDDMIPKDRIGKFVKSLLNEPSTFESIHRRKDGSTFDVEINTTGIQLDGQLYIYASTRDISERKRIENKLREKEETYRQFFEVNTSVKLVIDPQDGSIVQANQAAANLYGYSVETLLKMNISQINSLPDTEVLREMQAAKTEQRKYFNFKHRLASGEIRDVEVYSGPVTINGQSLLYSIIHDVTDKKRQEIELLEQQRRLNAIISGTNVGTWEWNVQTGETCFNRRWAEITGYSLRELSGSAKNIWLSMVDPGDSKIFDELLQKHFAGENEQFECTIHIRHKQGHWVWVLTRGRVSTWTPDGKPEWMYGTHLDVTHTREAEQTTFEIKQRLEAILNSTTVAISWANENGLIEYINPQFTNLFGYTLDDVPTMKDWFQLAHPEKTYRSSLLQEWKSKVSHSLPERKAIEPMEVTVTCKDGNIRYVLLQASWAGQVLLATFSDITVQKQRQQHIEHIAQHDALTGLPNRSLLTDRLQQYMTQVVRRNQKLAIVFLDLDGFKLINDKYGHNLGDLVLKIIAKRLMEVVRESDTVSRFGGDEFVVVLTDLNTEKESEPLLPRILEVINQPIRHAELELQVSGSLGVTFYPQLEEVDGDQLLRQSDRAMYQAKLAGKNRYLIFDSDEERRLRGYHQNLEHIHQAFVDEQFELYYQPKVNMKTGEIKGVEALIRWNHPDGELIEPGQFLPAIEKHQLSVEVGEWVIRHALQDMLSWQQAGLDIQVSINVFPLHLVDSGFMTYLQTLLAEYPSIPHECIEFEILETAALNDIDHVSALITECRLLGIRFALDDFGTGYSSLTYLKYLPAETLKIDQSFVRDMLEDHDDLAIVEGTLGLAKAFRRQVVAEGVETVDQGSLLLQLGCELAQGYGIARPMTANKISDWITSWNTNPAWLNQQPISYENIPMLYAEVEHRAWIRRIEQFLKDESRDLPPIENHNQCRFGEWLQSELARHHSCPPQLEQIDSLHKSIHEQAARLIELHQSHDAKAVERGRARLLNSRDKLLKMVNDLM